MYFAKYFKNQYVLQLTNNNTPVPRHGYKRSGVNFKKNNIVSFSIHEGLTIILKAMLPAL